MGQVITCCSRRSSTSRPFPPPCPSRLEQLPVELILTTICDFLSPASLAALSITSKWLGAVLVHNNMVDRSLKLDCEQRIDFLGLLERDLGQSFYLCTRCVMMHRFQPGCGPTKPAYYYGKSGCPHPDDLFIDSPPYYLRHHHVRLVMNRHLYGNKSGLSLRELEAVCVEPLWGGKEGWRQQWSARIIDDELFLRVKHNIHGHHEERLRRIIDTGYYRVCHHKPLRAWSLDVGSLEQPVALRPPSPSAFDSDSLAGSGARPLFKECEESRCSCRICLTDYTVNVKLRASEDADHESPNVGRDWEITVTAYHQLGKGRSYLDWKWVSFIATDRRATRWYVGRDLHPPGAVMAQWLGQS